MPADFLTRFAEAVPVNTAWLLTGQGSPDPVPPTQAERALNRITRVLESEWIGGPAPGAGDRAIDQCVAGIAAFDSELRYTLWNPGMERMRCTPAAQVLGRVMWQVFPFLQESGVVEVLARVLEGETVLLVKHPYRVPTTNRPGRADALCSPLRDHSGQVVGGLVILRDDTPWGVASA